MSGDLVQHEDDRDDLTISYMLGFERGKDATATAYLSASAEPVAWRWRYAGQPWRVVADSASLPTIMQWAGSEIQPLYAHPKEAPNV